MIGQTVSHYKILEKLGEGGMGVVYKAEDTKLKREVALKFLPARLGDSEADKARFLQEAQAAASLNHPNICTIYGIDEHEGQLFFAMEFVDGQTLRERMETLSFKQAVDVAVQIADGLAAAHEKGIVHRDIKPENIMIRRDGMAQVMDFGLAKLRASGSKITRLTKEGSTVGTAGYMSPEQVQGLETDHRSDIFSFGVLLYELLTRRLPFKGVHETALAYEIVNVDAAPMSVVNPEIDPNLDAIVLECLEKDPRERAQSIAQIAIDLKRYRRESSRQRASRVTAARTAFTPSQGMSATQAGVPTQGTKKAPSRIPWVVSAVCLVVALGAIAYPFLSPPKPVEKQVTRASILSPTGQVFDVTWGGHIAVSPDGKIIAFAASDSLGVNHLWVRSISSLTPIMLAGTDEAKYPFWSPDSRKLGYFARGKMRTIDATGGPVLTLCDANDGRGGSWSRDGIILFAPGPTEPISKVNAAGGAPVVVTKFDTLRHESSHRWPMFLPDGRHFVYSTLTASGTASDNDVVVLSALDSSVSRVLMMGTTNLCYAAGHILFIRQGALMAQPFDPVKLELSGDAIPVAEQVVYSPNYAHAAFSASDNGVLILQTGEGQTTHAAIFDVAGNRTHLIADANPFNPRFSPDAKRVMFAVLDPLTRNSDIWVNDLARGASTRLTFAPSVEINAAWSARGDSVVYQSNRNGFYDLFIKSADGAGDDHALVVSNRNKSAGEWSPDGTYLAYFTSGDPKTKQDIWLLPMTGERKPIPFLQSEFNENNPTFSPDSRWLVYQSDETGKPEIYARLVDGTGGKFKISTDGGRRPLWRADKRKLFFTSMDKKLQAAYVNTTPTSIVVDSIRALWDLDSRNISGFAITDASADGKQFIVPVTDSKLSAPPITLVQNWDEELKKK